MTRILVVDDEATIADAIQRALEADGYAVTTAISAHGALSAMAADPAAIVITDVIMPRVHGIELIGKLRSAYPWVRIIAISGGGSTSAQNYKPEAITTQAYLAAAERAGADCVLSKPFDLEDLLAAVRSLRPN